MWRMPLGIIIPCSASPPELVCLRGPCLDESLAGPMHCQDGQLFAVFNWHEAHVRAAHRLANGFGIGRIVLVGFDVRFDELRAISLTVCPSS